MRALLQRVTGASVSVKGNNLAGIRLGLVVFLGVTHSDTEDDVRYISQKILNLRIFPQSTNHFHASCIDIKAEILIVSQFTLYAHTRKGRRPDFTSAAPSQHAAVLYHQLVDLLKSSKLTVETGNFGEHMVINLQNDGPVTVMLDSADRSLRRRD